MINIFNIFNKKPVLTDNYDTFDDQDVFLNKDELIKLRTNNTNTKSMSSNESSSPQPIISNDIKLEYDYFLEDIANYKISDLIVTEILIPEINDKFIDENIKRTQSGRCLYSNGFLKMINNIATYIVPTPYYYDNNQINIYYELNCYGNKRIGYYKDDIFYILTDTKNYSS